MFETPPRYRSYLLTVWEERNVDRSLPVAWRFSLEDARTGQRRGFAGLEAFVAALRQEMANVEAEGRGAAAPSADQTSRPPGHSPGEPSSRHSGERR